MSQSVTPRICPRHPKPSDMHKQWRVWFKYYDTNKGKYVIISRRNNLNYFTDFHRRLTQAKILLKILDDRLKLGWNPITNTYPIRKTKEELELEQLRSMNFSEALKYAYDKKQKYWTKKTTHDYNSCVKYLKKAANKLDLFKPIVEFKKVDFKLILETVLDTRKLTGKGFNKYRSMLSALVGELVEWDILEYNPIRDIKVKPEQKTIAHRPPSQDQRLVIVDRIKTHYRHYYRFLSLLYGCAIRPKEITRIKIKHLYKLENMFRLTSDITKSRNARDVFIPRWVMDLLSEMNLHKYDPECYIFSGKGNMFMPGKNKMGENTHTRYWKKIVKEGLGLDVNQYSLKKLSGDDMVRLQRREGVMNLLELGRRQMGHSDISQTETYTTEHNAVLKEVIVNYMPEL